MDDIRVTVGRMAEEDLIAITQGGELVHDLERARGPIRLRIPEPDFGDDSD